MSEKDDFDRDQWEAKESPVQRSPTATEIREKHAREMERAVFGGPPRTPTYDDVLKEAERAVQEATGMGKPGGKLSKAFVYHCLYCAGVLHQNTMNDHYRCDRCGRYYTEAFLQGKVDCLGIPITKDVPLDLPASIEETIHILYQGSPLCRFTTDRPADWPKGHTWVPANQDMKGVPISSDSACKKCFMRSEKLFP